MKKSILIFTIIISMNMMAKAQQKTYTVSSTVIPSLLNAFDVSKKALSNDKTLSQRDITNAISIFNFVAANWLIQYDAYQKQDSIAKVQADIQSKKIILKQDSLLKKAFPK